jgi:hypothetical protein
MRIKLWYEKLTVRYHLEELGVEGRMILKMISEKQDRGARTGFIWLRIGIRGRL